MRAHGDALNGLSEPGQSRYALREWRPYLIDVHSMHPPAVSPEHLGPVSSASLQVCQPKGVCVVCTTREKLPGTILTFDGPKDPLVSHFPNLCGCNNYRRVAMRRTHLWTGGRTRPLQN
jgi:hypothetical protein